MTAETLTILFAGREAQRAEWEGPLREAAAEQGVKMRLFMTPEEVAPEEVHAVIYNPNGPVKDFAPYANLRAVLSLWAGVEKIVGDAGIKVPLARMVEPGLRLGMTDWVCAHVLRHHMGIDAHIRLGAGEWPQRIPPLARDRKVGVLGLGELGTDAAKMLAALRFDVAGWARSRHEIEGVEIFHGAEGLDAILARSEILVLLLPDTPDTTNLLDARRLALLPEGAVIVNPGRGPLIDDDALLAALDAGRISHATLDVFRVEPLPADHPYWAHPNVTVTPHIASATRPETASGALVEQIGRLSRGEPLLHLVDRVRGY
ncbi:MAG: glyoxylate/hydroxypyruvate reductase A [Pseudomonadota bacterium]|nr:glyoxylate/hydroxypyruvate reductase A [Pseudomonadota bacterium]